MSRVQLSRTDTEIDKFDPDFNKRNDRWLTPLTLIEKLGAFDLDPAGAPGHPTATEVWTPENVGDGLSLQWSGRVWLNPPYGREMRAWVERLAQHGNGEPSSRQERIPRCFRNAFLGLPSRSTS